MRLDDIRATVLESGADDWHIAETEWTDRPYRAVLREDLAVGLSWRLDPSGCPFEEAWVRRFPGTNTAVDCAITFHDAPVDRYKLVSVDGGRCYLPLPQEGTMLVRDDHLRLARLLQRLTSGYELPKFYDYFKMAGLQALGFPPDIDDQ